jgi:hypothetical protein
MNFWMKKLRNTSLYKYVALINVAIDSDMLRRFGRNWYTTGVEWRLKDVYNLGVGYYPSDTSRSLAMVISRDD